MNVDFYYRSSDKKLHKIHCTDISSIKEGTTLVMGLLHSEKKYISCQFLV